MPHFVSDYSTNLTYPDYSASITYTDYYISLTYPGYSASFKIFNTFRDALKTLSNV